MKPLNRVVVALGLLLVLGGAAHAQCSGQFASGTVCGNNGVDLALPKPTTSPLLKGTVTVTPPTGTTNRAFSTVQVGPASGSTAGPLALNLFETTFTSGVTGSGFDSRGTFNQTMAGWRWNLTTGSANLSGQVISNGFFSLAHTIAGTGSGFDLISLVGAAYSTKNSYGLYGAVPYSILDGTGSVTHLIGMESDVGVSSTASAQVRVGMRVVAQYPPSGNPALPSPVPEGRGASLDAAYAVANVGTAAGSFKKMFAIERNNDFAAQPLADDADILYSDAAITVANVIAGSNFTVTGSILTFPKVTLTGAGVMTLLPTLAANTSGDGLVLNDPTAASAGNQQNSPRLRLTGQGWKTNATAASQTVDWTIENKPLVGPANPQTQLVFSSQINGGGYVPIFTAQYNGAGFNSLVTLNAPTSHDGYLNYQVNGVNKWYLGAQGSASDLFSLINSDANSNITRFSISQAGSVAINGGASVAADSLLTLNANTVAAPAGFPATNYFHVVGADGAVVRSLYDSFGSVGISIGTRAMGGTAAVPTATPAGTALLAMFMGGYTNAVVSSQAGMNFTANTLWSASNADTYIEAYTTPTGSTTRAAAWRAQPSGGFSIGAAAIAADPGIGSLNMTGKLSVGGNAGFNGTAAIAKPTVTGSRGGNAAVASLLTSLANYGLLTDSSTP